jgi:hypothetical protein
MAPFSGGRYAGVNTKVPEPIFFSAGSLPPGWKAWLSAAAFTSPYQGNCHRPDPPDRPEGKNGSFAAGMG